MGCGCNTCGGCTGACGHTCGKKDCLCSLRFSWVPHTKCTLALTDGKCTDTIDLCPGIKNCQTVTHLDFNDQTGCIEFYNERYIDSDGVEGSLETVCVPEFYPFINVWNLNDVDFDFELDGLCYEFIYHRDASCEQGCKNKNDRWINWNVNSEGAKSFGAEYLRGASSDGCPTYIDKPANCSLLAFSPSCAAPTGEWQPYAIPDATKEITPNTDGRYSILTKNACGCIEESFLPVIAPGMAALNYQRDSVPDDPDFPWYYGNYNDRINLHLRENAAKYFGRFDLKVTVNYGIQAIKSDLVPNNNWRSLVVPVVEGEATRTEIAASILQGPAAATVEIPWGSISMRGSLTFVVPKGKEAYLHHEMRIRTASSFPNYYTGSWDGQRVPDIEATLNSVKHPTTRLNALQVLIEPTQGSTDYDPVKDSYRDKLDAAVDTYPQAF